MSIAFNNCTYASVDNNSFHNNKDSTDKKEFDVSYASVNPKTPKSRRPSGSGNETYMSVHAGNAEPEVLLKRSPVVRDVTTAHISPTNKLSIDRKTLPPLPATRKNSTDSSENTDKMSGYKLLSTIPGAGSKMSIQGLSSNNVEIMQSHSQNAPYKLLSAIPDAGKNIENKNSANSNRCKMPPPLNKLTAEKLTAPLTIIVPNISRAFARHSRSKSGDEMSEFSDQTISMELLNPKAANDYR